MTRHSLRVDAALRLMDGYASATGLTSDAPDRRYLWTDAYAVCNCLALHRVTSQDGYLELALELVDRVHRILGRHRPDDGREGWISGLPEVEGAQHPTAGGLRIGKPLPERATDQPPDPEAEWDRDGQYFHYLTRWMHALDRVWRTTDEKRHHRWAVELAEAAHQGFLASDGRRKRLHWKMSIDLSRPQVASAGHHDPLDGLLTVAGLVEGAPEGSPVRRGRLAPMVADLEEMCRGEGWATDDPLGAGGLLVDALRCVRLRGSGGAGEELPASVDDGSLCGAVLEDSVRSLDAVSAAGHLDRPLPWRMGFREVGLSIGLRAAARLLDDPGPGVSHSFRDGIRPHLGLADEIEEFWLEPEHREASGWSEHRDISRVMLATSLLPDGYLGPRDQTS